MITKNNTTKKITSNPIQIVMHFVGAKWKILIISELLEKEKRFSELKKALKCTSKVLIACLKEMEESGLLVREEENSSERAVYYYLTDLGYTMRPIVESMQKWGKEYKKLKKLQDKYNNIQV